MEKGKIRNFHVNIFFQFCIKIFRILFGSVEKKLLLCKVFPFRKQGTEKRIGIRIGKAEKQEESGKVKKVEED